MQGGDQGVPAGVCVTPEPKGSSQAEDVDGGVVANARGRGDQLVDGHDGVVELAWLALPDREAAFLQHQSQEA